MPRSIAHRILIFQQSALIPSRLRRLIFIWLGAKIHPTAIIHFGVRITYPANLTMAANSLLGANSYIDWNGKIDIGENVKIGANLTLLTSSYEVLKTETSRIDMMMPMTDHDMVISSGSWLGANVTILPGVGIAHGCVIAANSTVSRSTHPNGLYASAVDGPNGVVRARRIKDLETIEFSSVPNQQPASAIDVSELPENRFDAMGAVYS